MSIGPGGNMPPAEIQVKTNNLVEEVSTGRVERKCTRKKIFKYLMVPLGCLLFLLILVISLALGLKQNGETHTLKRQILWAESIALALSMILSFGST